MGNAKKKPKDTPKKTPDLSIKTLASIYRELLETGRIIKNGAAHSRLKFFDSIIQRRSQWRKTKNKMPVMPRKMPAVPRVT